MISGIVELCDRAGVSPGDLDGLLHGTTVATNAVLEHRGALTGMVTTEGMRDVVHIGRHQRPQPYSVMQDIPWQASPFVRAPAPPPGARADRTSARRDGWSRSTRTRSARWPRELRDAGVESVAVCFLFSYLNPANEERAAEILREELPDCFVTTSASVAPQFREFERFTTACMNAFVGPMHRPLPRAPGRGSGARGSAAASCS